MAPSTTVRGFWRSPVSDIEAQRTPLVRTYSSSSTATLPSPAPLHTHAPRTTSTPPSSTAITYNAVDAFFGVVSPTRGTLDSRHDEQPAPSALASPDEIPPAYAYPLPAPLAPEDEDEVPPSYAQTLAGPDMSEPTTLAQYFFKYGFLFPPLWFASLFILLSPLSAPADWEPTKTPTERAALLRRMRSAEVKWARRSLFAATLLTLVIVVAVVIGVLVSRSV
ncbi:hypothetical protein BV25DRAFT_1914027 [Artomyces pyxidatus]|uniref:Uncharacterized protein n=1 Tax=Artomyces pyxidatus TaxID=48021 RepID=A0ACB8T8Q1_9AGAM|nr:hypothetical protein BV25DRAFT_1914027 [Artomyces pyxidatus]